MNRWPFVKLGKVLRHRKEFITIHDLTNYDTQSPTRLNFRSFFPLKRRFSEVSSFVQIAW